MRSRWLGLLMLCLGTLIFSVDDVAAQRRPPMDSKKTEKTLEQQRDDLRAKLAELDAKIKEQSSKNQGDRKGPPWGDFGKGSFGPPWGNFGKGDFGKGPFGPSWGGFGKGDFKKGPDTKDGKGPETGPTPKGPFGPKGPDRGPDTKTKTPSVEDRLKNIETSLAEIQRVLRSMGGNNQNPPPRKRN